MDATVATRRVIQFLATLGVGYVHTSRRTEWLEWQEDGLQPAPFDGSLGVNWDFAIIYGYCEPHWAGLIHEAGHLVAVPQSPRRCDETEFLGWEIAVVLHLGLPLEEFYEANADYSIYWPEPEGDYYDTIGALSLEARERAQAYYIQRAKYLGTITPKGVPVAHPKRVFPPLTGDCR